MSTPKTPQEFYLKVMRWLYPTESISEFDLMKAEDFAEILEEDPNLIFYQPGSSQTQMFDIPKEKRREYEIIEKEFMTASGYSYSKSTTPVWDKFDAVNALRERFSGMLSLSTMDHFFYWFEDYVFKVASIDEINAMTDKDILVCALNYVASEEFRNRD